MKKTHLLYVFLSKRLLLLFMGLLVSQYIQAQFFFQMNDSMQLAMKYVYELRYNEAKKIIAQQRKAESKNVACDFIESTMFAVHANFNDNPKYFEQLKSLKSKYFDKIDQLSDANPWKRHLQAQMFIQQSFVYLKYEEYYSAFKALRSANKLLNANKKIRADFLPDQLPDGMINVVVSAIPDNIRWIAETFGLTGNYERGMQNMENVLNNAPKIAEYRWLEQQSLMFMAMVQMSLGDNPTQDQRIKTILEKRFDDLKNSPLLMNTLAILNIRTGNNDRAIELLQMILQKPQSAEYPILYYQLGRCRLQRMDADADQPFLSYLSHNPSNKFIKASYQHIAWHYFLKDNHVKYFENIKQVAYRGNTATGADKEAEKEYQRGTPPNKDLLKARLLFDGGYFNQALEILQNTDQTKFFKLDQLEYVYRLGRIYHGQKNYNQAILYYKKTLEQGSASTIYWVANAALMIGNVYEQQKNYSQAIIYYNRCQSMKCDEYENSIHQKAKVGENRCKRMLNH